MRRLLALAAAATVLLLAPPAAGAHGARAAGPVTGAGAGPRILSAVTGAGAGPRILSAGTGAGAGQNGHGAERRVGLIALLVLLLAGAWLAARALRRRRRALPRTAAEAARAAALRRRLGGVTLAAGISAAALLGALAGLGTFDAGSSPARSGDTLGTNPYLDPGTPLSGMAPNFTLRDETGRRVSLREYRGKVVMLAFNDAECTTICPLTSQAMLDAKAMLGRAASRVQLLGIDANPVATSVQDVASYTQLHGLVGRWHFLTGSCCGKASQLQRVWRAYRVFVDIQRGIIDHTPALFMIAPDGREAKIYTTQQSDAAVGQFGQLLAQEASRLLPGHPPVNARLSYGQIPGITSTETVSLPRAGGGRLTLGPSARGQLTVFFATWDREITHLGAHLQALDAYARTAAAAGLPPLTGIDEASLEPSPSALGRFLARLRAPLGYPVALDGTGRIADGYEAQGAPWFVLSSPSGRIVWYWEVDTQGWPSEAALVSSVRAALRRAPELAGSPAAVRRRLAGSPPALAALHDQASRLLPGGAPALMDRIRALRGHPIVVNAWESSCQPCRAEFGLFASAAATDGKRVAFLGADANDPPADGRAFLAQHPVSYPSYTTSTSALSPLGVVEGYPTTFFIDAAGRVTYVHDGQYLSLGTLERDIAERALAG